MVQESEEIVWNWRMELVRKGQIQAVFRKKELMVMFVLRYR